MSLRAERRSQRSRPPARYRRSRLGRARAPHVAEQEFEPDPIRALDAGRAPRKREGEV